MSPTLTASEYQQLGNASMGGAPLSEHKICKAFASALSVARHPSLIYWTHVDNGQRAGASESSRKIAGGIAKSEGTKAGHPDYYFIYRCPVNVRPNIAYIEFKTVKAGKKLKGAQKDFQDMCAYHGIHHAVCVASDEGMATLRAWGII